MPYLVGRPLDLGLEHEPGVQLVHRPPAELVRGLRSGALDVALVSSIELFRQPGYSYLEGLAVAGRGRVCSVQLFLRRPLPEVQRVSLDPASRTSAALVEVMLAARHGLEPSFREPAPGIDPRDEPADAWLRIGDPALRETFGPSPPPSFNPSEAWALHTGLPFVFALWIGAPGVDLSPWVGAFQRARERGRASAAAQADRAAGELGLPPEVLRHYLLQECTYELGAEFAPALAAWQRAAAARGHCRADLLPRAVDARPPDRPATVCPP